MIGHARNVSPVFLSSQFFSSSPFLPMAIDRGRDAAGSNCISLIPAAVRGRISARFIHFQTGRATERALPFALRSPAEESETRMTEARNNVVGVLTGKWIDFSRFPAHTNERAVCMSVGALQAGIIEVFICRVIERDRRSSKRDAVNA